MIIKIFCTIKNEIHAQLFQKDALKTFKNKMFEKNETEFQTRY